MKDTTEYKGYTIKIEQDEDAANPRTDFDNVGVMACWHRRCNLGDVQISDPTDYLIGLCQEIHSGFPDEQFVLYGQSILDKYYVILPLYLYEHGGMSMSTSNARYPFTDHWDAGQVGIISCSLEKAVEEWGSPGDSWDSPAGCYDGKERTIWQAAKKCLQSEVEVYNQFLTGDVWGYCVTGPRDFEDSCWGFYGYDYCLEEAKSIVDHHAQKSEKKAWSVLGEESY